MTRWGPIIFATVAVLSAPAAQAEVCLFDECWGGVGLSADDEAFWSFGQGTQAEVLEEARRHCGGECPILRTFRDACGALAIKELPDVQSVWGWSVRDTRFEAELHAMDECLGLGGGGACHVVAWACSVPYPESQAR